MNALNLGRVEGETPTLYSNSNNKLFKGELLVKRFLSVFVTSMFLASAAFAADAVKEEKKADAKAGEKTKGDAKAGAVKEDKKAEPAKGGEKAKGEAKGDVKASEKAKEAKAGAMGEEKKASK
jgi:opacity protein-like surface antigen